MQARHVLYAMLALTVVSGAMEAVGPNAPPPPAWWVLLSAFLTSFLPYYWYRLDSEGRCLRPSRWMNTGVVTMTVIGMPVYLLRSRPRGQRARALLRCVGFMVLILLAAMLGAVLRVIA
jgi:phosphatidylglycerophosphate synthase